MADEATATEEKAEETAAPAAETKVETPAPAKGPEPVEAAAEEAKEEGGPVRPGHQPQDRTQDCGRGSTHRFRDRRRRPRWYPGTGTAQEAPTGHTPHMGIRRSRRDAGLQGTVGWGRVRQGRPSLHLPTLLPRRVRSHQEEEHLLHLLGKFDLTSLNV